MGSIALTACGGGAVATSSIAGPASATPSAQSSFTTHAAAIPASGNAFALPAAGGYAGALAFANGALPAGVTVGATVTDQAPAGVTALATNRRSAASLYSSDALVYYGLTFSAPTTASGAVSLQVTIPAGIAPGGSSFWLALYDPTLSPAVWQDAIAGPAGVSGTSLTFTIAGGYAFVASQTYWFAVYALAAGTPTPAPTSAAMNVSPPTLSITGTGSANNQNVTVIEPGYRGYFQVSSADPTIATVNSPILLGPSATIVVTPQGGGNTTITIGDQNGQSKTVQVGVTAGTVTVQSGVRHE